MSLHPHLRKSRFAELAGAVLLGGASSRMGRDKASMVVGGVPAAVRVARLLASLFEEVLLVGGEPPPEAPGRRVADPPGPACALRGLVAALEAVRAPRVLVTATDLPLLTPELLLGLVAWPEAPVVLPHNADGRQPLCALYTREVVLPVARANLAAGRLALHELLAELEVAELSARELAVLDPDGRALANANSPEDLARIEALIARQEG